MTSERILTVSPGTLGIGVLLDVAKLGTLRKIVSARRAENPAISDGEIIDEIFLRGLAASAYQHRGDHEH